MTIKFLKEKVSMHECTYKVSPLFANTINTYKVYNTRKIMLNNTICRSYPKTEVVPIPPKSGIVTPH